MGRGGVCHILYDRIVWIVAPFRHKLSPQQDRGWPLSKLIDPDPSSGAQEWLILLAFVQSIPTNSGTGGAQHKIFDRRPDATDVPDYRVLTVAGARSLGTIA